MSSTFCEMISYLKPLLSESDYNRLNHDLNLRETSWNSQNDIHYHRVATLEGHNLAMSKELKDYSVERGELLLSNSDLEQKVTELNSELGILRRKLNDDYELKLAELKREVQILNKQCLNWSEENRDLKVGIGKLEGRAKETANMYEKIKQNLELEKGKTVELEKKKREAEEKYEAVLLAGTKKYRVLEDQMGEIEQTGAELLSVTMSPVKKVLNVVRSMGKGAKASDIHDGCGPLTASERRAKETGKEAGKEPVKETIPYKHRAKNPDNTVRPTASSRSFFGELFLKKLETANMYDCEKFKQNLESEKGKTVELKKKKREAVQKYEAVLLACTKKYRVLEDQMVEIEQTGAELLSGPQAESSINVNKGQQTNAQETIPCLQKASITSPPIVEQSDYDEDGEIKRPKRKLSPLEASENRSKQLKGSGKESVNASTSVAASHIGGTSLSLINEHEDAVQDDYSDQCWEYVANMLEALDKDIELCMKGVCALYQQYLNVFSRPRDVALAKFLVNGDREGRLKRSVVELEKFDQYASNNCKKIAFNNSTLLFGMYKSKACRFFGP